jgi:hypothetical protein
MKESTKIKSCITTIILTILFICILIVTCQSCSVQQPINQHQQALSHNGESLFIPNPNDRKIVGYNKNITKYLVVDYKNKKCPPVRICDTILPVGEILICYDEYRSSY